MSSIFYSKIWLRRLINYMQVWVRSYYFWESFHFEIITLFEILASNLFQFLKCFLRYCYQLVIFDFITIRYNYQTWNNIFELNTYYEIRPSILLPFDIITSYHFVDFSFQMFTNFWTEVDFVEPWSNLT